jgi:hypothetical protein
MLWLLQYHSVQFLIVIWLIQVIYTAYATLQARFDHRIKSFIIVLLFITSYYSIIMSGSFLGTPNFSDDEVQGLLDGFDIFTHDGVKEFAVMVTTDKGPLLITLPFDIKGEANLDQAMNRRALTGMPTMIRKRSKRQMAALKARDGVDVDKAEFDNGQVELFDFTDQVLTAKTPDSPTRK